MRKEATVMVYRVPYEYIQNQTHLETELELHTYLLEFTTVDNTAIDDIVLW